VERSQATFFCRVRHRVMIRLLFGLTLAVLACAQGQAPPTFEVASIKPNRTGAPNSGFRRAGPGMLNALNDTLKMLVQYAYDVQDYQVIGGPNWFDSDRYDVLAKPEAGADAGSATPAERTALLRRRVQSLLADRFQLTLHRTTKELPMFALVVGKTGPKLKESTSSASELVSNGHHLTCNKVALAALAKVFLQGELRRPVADQTGLKGEFDFTLDWVTDNGERKAASEESSGGGEGPSLFTALQEQLGLRLEPQKGPVEILVIDRAERPSEN
jgi:bla regulator protein blaR1